MANLVQNYETWYLMIQYKILFETLKLDGPQSLEKSSIS